MFITPSFKKSLIVEQFQGNYLKWILLETHNSENAPLLEWTRKKEAFETGAEKCVIYRRFHQRFKRKCVKKIALPNENVLVWTGKTKRNTRVGENRLLRSLIGLWPWP